MNIELEGVAAHVLITRPLVSNYILVEIESILVLIFVLVEQKIDLYFRFGSQTLLLLLHIGLYITLSYFPSSIFYIWIVDIITSISYWVMYNITALSLFITN